MQQINSRIYLEYLLKQSAEQPARQAEIVELIDEIFGQDKAVMVIDMCGFCRRTRDYNIITVLTMIYQMEQLSRPCIEAHGGRLIKADADNLYCLFDTVADALRAHREISDRLDESNRLLPEDCRLDISTGIGYGRVLNIEDKDIFGAEVNFASKLGEDIAGSGEVLLTENAFLQLQDVGIGARELTIEISEFSMRYHLLEDSPCGKLPGAESDSAHVFSAKTADNA
jgi:adenylate cyclase